MDDKFCEKCGCKLEPSFRFYQYSFSDGEKVYSVNRRCPNDKWWWQGHTRMDNCLWRESTLIKAGFVLPKVL